MKLDQRAVAQLKLPASKSDVIYFDDDLAGFGLRIRAGSGRTRRTWVVQYKVRGRTKRMKLGVVEKLGTEQARKAAKKILAKVELGDDPQGDKTAARLRAAHTLKSVAEQYLAAKQSSLRPASYRVTSLYLLGPAYFGPLHAAAITDITLADVASRIGAITRNSGSVTASRARAALSALYTWAAGEGLLGAQPFNPVAMSNKPQDSKPRERVLSDVELVAIWRACGENDYGRAVKLLILTGCRREEIGGLRWSEVDLDEGTLTLPGERTKNGRPHTLPLPPLARSIIAPVCRRLHRDHVFGERAERGFTAWAASKHELDGRLAGRVGPSWRVHDLRRTAATRMAELGVQPHIIEAVLNHVSGHKHGVAGIYNRATYEPDKRQALALWAEHLLAIVEGRKRVVVPLKRGTA
jgi:integrase